jgi:hypothetical protein
MTSWTSYYQLRRNRAFDHNLVLTYGMTPDVTVHVAPCAFGA